jgi:hypothetical protein
MLEDKLAGASLLIFANKQDLKGALPVQRIAEVPGKDGILLPTHVLAVWFLSHTMSRCILSNMPLIRLARTGTAACSAAQRYQRRRSSMADFWLQRHQQRGPSGRL